VANSLETGLKSIATKAKVGAQRLPVVPIFSGALPEAVPSGTIYANSTDQKVFFQLNSTTTIDLTAPTGGSGGPGGTPETDIDGHRIISRSIPNYVLQGGSITSAELAPGSVGVSELATEILASSSIHIDSPGEDLTPLVLDVPFASDATVSFIAKALGDQKFRVGPDSVAAGADITDSPPSVFSVYSFDEDRTLIRGRGRGDFIYFDNDIELPIFTVNHDGDMFVGGDFSSGGIITAQEGLAIDGPLTVTAHGIVGGNLSIGEDFIVAGPAEFGGQATFSSALLFPSDYSFRVGSTAWFKSPVSTPNRVVIEGATTPGIGELQLGTGGPVLRSAPPDTGLWVGAEKAMTAAPGGVIGSQIAFDTITGGASSGQGNIASQTVQGYNIKDGSVVRSKLAVAAVAELNIEDGSLTDDKILNIRATRLISGILDANEIFMGPNGTLYMGPVDHAHITDQRVQLDHLGLRSFNTNNDTVAEVLPSSFMLRSGTTGSRLLLSSDSGLTLYDVDGSITTQLAPTGVFSLTSKYSGARTVLDSQDGLRFIASPARNMAYNPGFNGGSQHEVGFNAEAVDDQRHVFAGEYGLRMKATVTNPATQSYVDVPFKSTVGTGTTITRTRTNYCPNPSLATVITGWSGTIGAAAGVRAAGVGFAQPNVLKLTAAAVGTATVLGPVVTGLTSAQQWSLSANVRTTTTQSATPIIQWLNSSDVVLSEVSALPVTVRGGVVEILSVTATAPANTAKVRLKLLVTMISTDILEVSNALYERASGLDEYFDGDTSGYQWSGTAGNSASTLIPVSIPDSLSNLISIFVWSDTPCWTRIEGRDSTAGVSRGISTATRILPNQWTRVFVSCTGVMDKVRLHAPTSDISSQIRVKTYLWYSALQVERDGIRPTPFCSGTEPGCYWEAVAYASASLRDVDVVTAQLSPSLGVTVSAAIVGGSVTGSTFFAGMVSASEIHGGLITGSLLQGNYITGDQIVANTVTGDKFLSNTLISNVSLQTGTVGRRVLISGPNNEIRFFPVADETRYASLYSYVPADLPNDISVELRSITSAAVSMISRVRIKPNQAFLGLTTANDGDNLAGGVVYCDNTRAFVGVKTGGIDSPGNGAGFSAYTTGELKFTGWFRNGGYSANQAVMTLWVTIPGTALDANLSFGGFTMSNDMLPILTGVEVTNQVYGSYAWTEQLTRTNIWVAAYGAVNAVRAVNCWLFASKFSP
jgi:hypothetical protein